MQSRLRWRPANSIRNELERCEERLFALRAMSRKYCAPIEALPALAQKFADDLAALEAGRSEVAQARSRGCRREGRLCRGGGRAQRARG